MFAPNHQYITRQNDGWYLMRDRVPHGPFRWYWLAWLASIMC